MRILHWYPNFLGGGGVANAVLGLATAQAQLGAEVAVGVAKPFGPPLYEAMDTREHVHILRWQPCWRLRLPGFLLRGIPKEAVSRLQEFRPDIVHIHGEFNPDNWWAPRLFQCPMVLSPHGSFHPEVFMKSRQIQKKIYFRIARRLLYQHMKAFHAVSPIEQEYIAKLLPKAWIYSLPNGPNIRAPEIRHSKNTVGDNSAIRFVFVGRLALYQKGLDILLEAFANAVRLLHGQKTKVVLTLIGPDWQGGQSWLQHRSEKLGITNQVFFTGPLSGKELAAHLGESDIYIQLSRYEGFPLSVAEALVVGMPAILSWETGIASYPEIACLPHVRVVPPKNIKEATKAIVEFAQRVNEVKATAAQHLTKVRNFLSWERIANLHLEMYEKLRNETL